MKSTVSVTQERRISASPGAVWSVICAPEMHERLDSRCHLHSTMGGGEVGSEYVLIFRAGLLRTRLRYVIRESIPETRWTAHVERGGKEAGVQHAELVPEPGSTMLRWTVSVPAGRLTRRAVTASCDRELEKWLAAVDREALAHGE